MLTAELDAHAQEFCWSPDGAAIYFLVAERGRVDLRRVSLDGGSIETVSAATARSRPTTYLPMASQVGFVASTDRAPYDLYVADLEGSERSRLTEVNGDWLAGRTLGDVEDLWFESADGTPIQGWIVKPPDFDPGQKYPLVLSIHGGPHVMWSRHEPTMWHEWQVQAAAGYVVFASNPRGSDGYGRDFRAAALNHWGEADLPDLLAGVEQVLAKGYVDPERLVVTGGSYGGFMTAWVIGHDDRFKAAVAQRGVYDLHQLLQHHRHPALCRVGVRQRHRGRIRELTVEVLAGGLRRERSIRRCCSSIPRTTTARPSLPPRACLSPCAGSSARWKWCAIPATATSFRAAASPSTG